MRVKISLKNIQCPVYQTEFCYPLLGSELRKLSTESKVRNTRTPTRGNGWRPRGGSSLAGRRARPSDGVTLSAGAQRRHDLRWSETTRMAPKTSCHDQEPRERPRAPRPTGSDPDVRTVDDLYWLIDTDEHLGTMVDVSRHRED